VSSSLSVCLARFGYRDPVVRSLSVLASGFELAYVPYQLVLVTLYFCDVRMSDIVT
jgi:hypothetical protein